MLGREVFVGGRAGVSVLKLDLMKLKAVLERTFSLQHQSAAKVLVEIAEVTADEEGMSPGLRVALCELVAVQWPRGSITMSCLRALQDADD